MIKHNITSAVLIMASIGILALPANAQEKRVVKARAICFERTAETPDIFISGPKEPYKILMPVEGFSMTFKCALDQGKAIFYKEDGVKPDGTPRRKIVAQTKVNGSMSKVLFYFVPNKEGAKRLYQVIAMEDGLKRFPLGHTRLLNLSDSEVVFQLGEHVKRLSSGKSAHVAEVTKRNDFNMALVVCKMKTKDGQWRTISESRTRFTNRKRLLVVSYVNPATRQPQLKFYKDIPIGPPPPLPNE
ncbi:MAG: hypothetical protein QNL01_13000 [Akkermansiaceae bacterium]|jgi:hypothetical protein|tara:strand:+ start:14064 stop:14795 length:732 start_codon:yes stop_codon:yes gene_type:complete